MFGWTSTIAILNNYIYTWAHTEVEDKTWIPFSRGLFLVYLAIAVLMPLYHLEGNRTIAFGITLLNLVH